MAHCTYTTSITLPDGTTAEHTAEALSYSHESDGSISILAACCGMVGGTLCDCCNGAGCAACGFVGLTAVIPKAEDTRSRHTFYDIGRPTSDGTQLVEADIQAEVAGHVQRVAELHASRHLAKVSKLDLLVRPKGVQPGANS
jgi:hypothetical protein